MMRILALAALQVATQSAVAEPTKVQAGTLEVSNATMMGWFGGGQLAFTVLNQGDAPDRVVSVASPAGTVSGISVQTMVDGRVVDQAEGDRSLPPSQVQGAEARTGLSRVTADLTDLTHLQPANRVEGQGTSIRTTITIVFEKAGPVTLSARPVSPAPPSPRR